MTSLVDGLRCKCRSGCPSCSPALRWRERGSRRRLPRAPAQASDPATPSGPRPRRDTGVTKPVGARLEGASLLRRVSREKVLACPWGGRLRIVADLSVREVLVALLESLGLPSEAPPFARARSPGCEAA